MKQLTMPKILVIGNIIALLLFVWWFVDSRTKLYSKTVLHVTHPVFTLEGIIEKVDSGSIMVVKKENPGVVNEKLDPDSPTPTPTRSPIKPLTYRVLITDETIITQPINTIPYLFATPPSGKTPTTARISIGDLYTGQTVSIATEQDLRLLKSTTFTATHITTPMKNIYLNGVVKNISSTQLLVETEKIKGTKKNYTVRFNKNTEFSTYPPQEDPLVVVKPLALSIQQVKKGQRINIYTQENVDNTDTVTALRIEPIQHIPVTPSADPIPTRRLSPPPNSLPGLP